MDNAELRAIAREQLKGKWGPAALATLIYVAILAGVQVVPFAGSVASLIIGGPLTLGYTIYIMHIARDEEAKYDNLFEGFNQFSRSLVAYLLVGLFTFLWSLLLIVPGIIKGISYSMTFFILRDNPDMTASEALKESMRIMDGHKMEYFMLSLSFIGWLLLSVLTCGILTLWVSPYMEVTYAHFYESIKQFVGETPAFDSGSGGDGAGGGFGA